MSHTKGNVSNTKKKKEERPYQSKNDKRIQNCQIENRRGLLGNKDGT